MSAQSQWQDENASYVTAAVACVRLRLERLGSQQQPPLVTRAQEPLVTAMSLPEESHSRWLRFRRADAPMASLDPPRSSAIELPAATTGSIDEQINNAQKGLSAAEKIDPPPALVTLSQLLRLSDFERDVLLLCAAMEFDTGIAARCALAQGDPSRPYPTFALALLLLDGSSWDALSPERGLRYWRLLEITQPDGRPLTSCQLRADERIINYIKGLNYLDDRLTSILTPIPPLSQDIPLPKSQGLVVDRIVHELKVAVDKQKLPAIQLLGGDKEGKQLIARKASDLLNISLYNLPAQLLPQSASELETVARLWQRESLLLQAGIYVTDADANPANSGLPPLAMLLERVDNVVFLETRDRLTSVVSDALTLDIASPTVSEQVAAWHAALGDASPDSPGLLASQFSLGQQTIQKIASHTLAKEDTASVHDRLWSSCLEVTRPQLDILAQRIIAKAIWEDLVLPQTAADLLRQISAQVGQRNTVYQSWGFANKMSRGFGISALFAGDSGTGKTMAAEVIANQLKLNLYRIDLSAVVSKYIGQTEKNLRQVFDAAEAGGAILFFDEADALFGKRSEVKDSHDRYANIEINYLLQRMEAYSGLAILATNMRSALDQAFLRRLRFIIDFPFPSAAQRKAIWQKVFPPNTPIQGLDFDALARLNLTGGNIQSIALNAAFAAAEQRTGITHQLLIDTARWELRKLGRTVNELEMVRQIRMGAK